jgi:hypothetical protein
MTSEAPKWFPSENGCILDVHNIGMNGILALITY